MSTENQFAPVSENNITDFKAHFVGEGKKYATEEEAFKGLYHANNHIQTVEQDAEKLRQELATVTAVEELLKQNVSNPNLVQPTPVIPEKPEGNTSPAGEVPSREELSDLIRQALAQENKASQKAENFNRAITTLDKVFGSRDAANAAVAKRAAELGVGVELLRQAAEQSPASLFAMMDVDTTKIKTEAAPSKTDVTPAALNVNSSNSLTPGTYRYYENMRKTDPARYNRASTQKEMFDAGKADPDKFFERT